MKRFNHFVVICSICLVFIGCSEGSDDTQLRQRFVNSDQLEMTTEETDFGLISRGHYKVFENRQTQEGRVLELEIVVLHALGENVQADPIFSLSGGPGVAAADGWRQFANSWMRQQRDIVLVSQRGTGGTNRLAFPSDELSENAQAYLNGVFTAERTEEALSELSQIADLRMYSTPIAMDDLNEIREALGYEQINLIGGSYGTRAALIYIRRHEATVRTATLNGVAPLDFTNPLYHARAAQRALDLIFDEVEANESYQAAFPNLRGNFHELLKRLEETPAQVDWRDPSTGQVQSLELTREAFCSSLRFQLYTLNTSRQVPLLIQMAHQGEYEPFVTSAIARNRGLQQIIAMGMLMSVTAAEDVARINPDDIATVTENTFLGDRRVRAQIEMCKLWPKSELPHDFATPVRSAVPTLILSGQLDPVTPPRWGEVVDRNFENSIHVIAPAAHGVGGACIDQIQRQFLESGSVDEIDTSCVEQMQLPPLVLPTLE